MGRAAAAVAQAEQEEVCISAKESFELVRCLLRVSIYHVSYLRGLFPDSMFSGATMNNLGGVTVQMLGGEGVRLSPGAQQLKEWVERGAVEAVRRRYLKRLYFGVAADAACTNVLEEFVFSFQYGADGADGAGALTTMRLDATANGAPRAVIDNLGGAGAGTSNNQPGQAGAAAAPAGGGGAGGKMVSVKQVKSQIFRLMRTLVELCGTLEEVPEERHIFMRLTYHDGAPEDYEPPHFAPATEEQASATFAAQPFSMKAGSLSTEHHHVSVRVKSLLDAVEACGGPAPLADPTSPAPRGAAAGAAAGDQRTPQQQQAGAAMAAAAAAKGDELDEGGAAVAWSGGAGAGDAPAGRRRDKTPAGQRGANGGGIMREVSSRPRAAVRGAGAADAQLGPSQEVDGPAAAAAPAFGLPVLAEECDAAMDDGEDEPQPAPTAPVGGGDGSDLQLTLAPGAGGGDDASVGGGDEAEAEAPPHLAAALRELSIHRGKGGGAMGQHHHNHLSQLSQLSTQAAEAVEGARAHALKRLAAAGAVDKMDVAAKWCAAPLPAIDAVFDALVAAGAAVRLDPTGDRYVRPGAGESSLAAVAGMHDDDDGAMMPPPPPPPTVRKSKRAAAGVPAPAAGNGGGSGGGAAFDPDGVFGSGMGASGAAVAPVLDASQTSRRGAGGAKRKKTSICSAPIAQGAIPDGKGAAAAIGAGDGISAATATPNGSNTRGPPTRGRLAGMRRGGARS